ncbi:U7 snRNA-associated Sm-like protein LSm11 [Brachyistius frenatus]|uniref:U7 snRNA-associated Sm-like protein LSm11 n=1 Tax=Brachyistius frenatus TaxID=100188 RepID=UPI0037E80CA6
MEERERKRVKSGSKETAAVPGSSRASVPEQTPEARGESGDGDAETTNVCSERFDPLLALYSPAVSLPFPNIKGFNNVAEYESFLKGGRGRAKPHNVERKQRKAMKGAADPERIDRLKKLMVNNPVTDTEEGESSGAARRRRRQKPQKNVLTRMPLCKGSPLGELYRCVQERIRVKVHIRTFKGLRGVCSGFVVAFDKFWNMAMVDVDETYREPLFGMALYHEKALTISRLFEKLDLQKSSGGDEPLKKQEASEQQPADPQTAPKSHPARPGGATGRSSAAEAELSEAVEAKRDKHKGPLTARGPRANQRKDSQTYGRVCTRHVNQLFIRGENVVLVNPQPL